MNEASAKSSNPGVEERVIQVINDEIRPAVQMDGGDIHFVGMDGNVVNVRLAGACVGCPSATMTLTMGVERRLKQLIPEIERVVNVGMR